MAGSFKYFIPAVFKAAPFGFNRLNSHVLGAAL